MCECVCAVWSQDLTFIVRHVRARVEEGADAVATIGAHH